MILNPVKIFAYDFSEKEIKVKNSDILISWIVDKNSFPEYWQNREINPQAESLKKKYFKNTLSVIEKAISKYPASFLNKNLKKVYVFHSLKFYGISYGGSNSRARVYLTSAGRSSGYTDEYIEMSFHHELSSILLRNHKTQFSEDKWKACNEPSFQYGKGGVNAIKENKASLSGAEKYYQKGFLNQYGKSALEEDFNTYAGEYFVNQDSLEELAKSYPTIQCKLSILKNFYKDIIK